MTLVVILGILAVLAGGFLLVSAIRTRGDGNDPRNNAKLIGGTMLAAFGLVIAGFAIAYSTTEPLDLNASAAQ